MKRKINISKINLIFAMIFILIAAALFFISLYTVRHLTRMQETTEKYIAGQEAISSMREASDLLTEKARGFVVSGDPEDLVSYMNEIHVDRNRDKALETLEEIAGSDNDTEMFELLKSALQESDELAEVETYAMRLAAEGYALDRAVIEEHLGDVALSEADLALAPEEQVSRAVSMMFDEDYDVMKDRIISDVLDSLEDLTEKTKEEQKGSYEATRVNTRAGHILLGVLLASVFALLLIQKRIFVDPIRDSVACIGSNEPLPLKGSAEIIYLSETYNKMLEKTKQHSEALSYEATHDALTGIYNRKQFEVKRNELAEEDFAMLLFDVDYFKDVNDTYGHEAGDSILKHVAQILSSSFRLEDCICRIGGDEFAVMMVSVGPELKPVVETKIRIVREKLASSEEEPRVTLSIGAAFSGDPGDEDVFKKADLALYRVKEKGRDGYTFYSDL